MLNVTFYNTSDDNLKVNKTLTSVGSYNCDLLEECSVTNPSIIVNASGSLATCNYAYIADWHRYYYVKPTILDGNRIRMDLTVDRLMSFVNPNKGSIQAYIERNEFNFDKSIVDEQAIFTNDRDVITKNVSYYDTTISLSNWKLIGVFNAGLCNTANNSSENIENVGGLE